MKVGDLVRFSPQFGRKYGDGLMIITGIHESGNLVRYWHPKFGDGGWAGLNMFISEASEGEENESR